MTIVRLVLTFIPFVTVAAYTSQFQARSNGPMALVGATLIDGTGAPPLSDAVILIEKDRILRVGPRSQVRIPDGADRKDLTGLKILPGLIDSHVHITFALPRGPSDPQADATINGVLQQFLRHGVTSIRDLGAGYPWILDLTRSVEQGRREGPRIFAAGPMLTALGGHPAGTLLRGNDGAIASGTRQIVSPEQGREVVRDLASSGVDVIKAVLDSLGDPTLQSVFLRWTKRFSVRLWPRRRTRECPSRCIGET